MKSVIHSEASAYYNRYNVFLCYPSLIITSLCGSAIVMNNTGYLFVNDRIGAILIVLNILSCCVLVICSCLNFTNKSDKHLNSAREYSKLFRSIHYFRCKQEPQFPHSDYIEVFSDNIRFEMNVISEAELECPESILNRVMAENEGILNEKYFIAQTLFKEHKYKKSDIKYLRGLCADDFKKIIQSYLFKQQLREQYKYINVSNATANELIDIIIVELNIDPLSLANLISIPYDEEAVIYSTSHKVHVRSISSGSSVSCASSSHLVHKIDNLSQTISSSESYIQFKQDLEKDILKYYKKFKQCSGCGMRC